MTSNVSKFSQSKKKKKVKELENDDIPLNNIDDLSVISFVNLYHNYDQNRKYEHRIINYVKKKILKDKLLNYSNKNN